MGDVATNREVCPECASNGVISRLRIYQVGWEDAVNLCENETCLYPLGVEAGFEHQFLTQQKASEVGFITKKNSKHRKKNKMIPTEVDAAAAATALPASSSSFPAPLASDGRQETEDWMLMTPITNDLLDVDLVSLISGTSGNCNVDDELVDSLAAYLDSLQDETPTNVKDFDVVGCDKLDAQHATHTTMIPFDESVGLQSLSARELTAPQFQPLNVTVIDQKNGLSTCKVASGELRLDSQQDHTTNNCVTSTRTQLNCHSTVNGAQVHRPGHQALNLPRKVTDIGQNSSVSPSTKRPATRKPRRPPPKQQRRSPSVSLDSVVVTDAESVATPVVVTPATALLSRMLAKQGRSLRPVLNKPAVPLIKPAVPPGRTKKLSIGRTKSLSSSSSMPLQKQQQQKANDSSWKMFLETSPVKKRNCSSSVGTLTKKRDLGTAITSEPEIFRYAEQSSLAVNSWLNNEKSGEGIRKHFVGYQSRCTSSSNNKRENCKDRFAINSVMSEDSGILSPGSTLSGESLGSAGVGGR